jgi:hypothetical protein
MNIEAGEEYRGSLMRGEEQLDHSTELIGDECLRWTPMEDMPRIRDEPSVELFTQEGYWRVQYEEATKWLLRLVPKLMDRKVWITRNGRYWINGGVTPGDNFRVAGAIPPGISGQLISGIDLSPKLYEGMTWWSDWVHYKDPKPIWISIHQVQKILDEFAREIAAGRMRVTRNHRAWAGERVDANSDWSIRPTIGGGAPKQKGIPKPPPRPPPVEVRPKVRIYLHCLAGNKEVWIDPKLDMTRHLMTLVSVAGYSDPTVWNIHDNNGRMLMRTEELTPERIVHLRGKIEVEIEDRRIRFDVHEDEKPEITFSHLFSRLRILQE